ncbi:hypothetical protein IFM89_027189 [Coptis chinensis]|uniref:Uncharacterized protein n=1 Tax=Coptis chinensis TaxID=261450 RepID=A0A835M1W5_9MAGN|nr:hypothetical protein IFM89_027189 [Coptis chinensis]
MAASKFQEVAALAFFNWGNVHMCAARKRIPLDDNASKEVITAQLQLAYDWVKEKYALAGEKYEEALKIKPDFYEGLLALGQQHFETAKLQWSFTLANKVCRIYIEWVVDSIILLQFANCNRLPYGLASPCDLKINNASDGLEVRSCPVS